MFLKYIYIVGLLSTWVWNSLFHTRPNQTSVRARSVQGGSLFLHAWFCRPTSRGGFLSQSSAPFPVSPIKKNRSIWSSPFRALRVAPIQSSFAPRSVPAAAIAVDRRLESCSPSFVSSSAWSLRSRRRRLQVSTCRRRLPLIADRTHP